MSIDTIRGICRKWPGVTEDVKWGDNLVFSVGGKMFATVDLDPPHAIAFKCSDEGFAELIEREGIVPAPYLARAKWVQEIEFGKALDRRGLATRPEKRVRHRVVKTAEIAPEGSKKDEVEGLPTQCVNDLSGRLYTLPVRG